MSLKKIYRGCPYDRETWFSVTCDRCIYALYSNDGNDNIIGCSNYDEYDDENDFETIDQLRRENV